MRELPTGTVTLLFTDIEGSTRLLDELGAERYADVLEEHRRVLREAFARHGGVEIDTQGDAFFVAFARAGDAVAAAAEAVAALGDGPVRIRVGVHTGEPIVRDGSYVGADVHRAARVMGAAHGGQVLASQSTRELLDGRDARDLGVHRLKDVGELRLFQVGKGSFPPLRSLNNTNLSAFLEPLLGRKRELADLLRFAQVERRRLLTLTGPGGIGKTRLALELAAEIVPYFEHGVWFVDLSPVREADLVLDSIAAALGAPTSVTEYISDRALLLVLDNFEQVVDAAPEVGSLLETCPRLQLVVTSREPLRIAGEREYAVRPLAEAPAVELFRQRVEASGDAADGDYSKLVELCRRLDNLPLAIELAAARAKTLSLDELSRRLDRRLPMLAKGRRDAPERQRTLRATIGWSYELLTPEEQTGFAGLAVFRGGWTLAAAEAVSDVDADVLDSLVDKSLVRRDGDRFSMLETIREYAAERLATLGKVDEMSRRLSDFLWKLALEVERSRGSDPEARQRFAAEQDNFRAALAWAAERGDTDVQLDLIAASWPFWWYRGNAAEGLRWVEAALTGSGGETSRRTVQVLAAGAMFAHRHGDVSALDRFSGASLDAARRLGDPATMIWPLILRALSATRERDYAQAATLNDEAIALAGAVGERHLIGIASNNLGSNAMEEKHYQQAIEFLEQALAISHEVAAYDEMAVETLNLALCLYRTGRTREACESAKTGVTLALEFHSLTTLSYGLILLGALAHRQGCPAVAVATLIGAAEGLFERVGETIVDDPELFELFESTRRELVRVLGDNRCAQAFAEGKAMPLDDAVDYALASVD